MDEVGNARSLLGRIYELTEGTLSVIVHPTQLAENRTPGRENAEHANEDMHDVLASLGLLWFGDMVDLTQSRCVLLTSKGKETVEIIVRELEAYVDECPEALAEEASGEVH